MTFDSLFGGLPDLTALNRRLVSNVNVSGVSFQTTGALAGTEEEEEAVDEAAVDELGIEVRGRFRTADPLEFQRIREWIQANIFYGDPTQMDPAIDAWIDEWDVYYRNKQGRLPSRQFGELVEDEDEGLIRKVREEGVDPTFGATLERLLADEEFYNGALWLPVTMTNQLPPLFTSAMPTVDAEGNPTGEFAPTIAVSNPLTGVTFRTVEEVAARRTPEANIAFNRVMQSGSPIARDLFQAAIASGISGNIPIPGQLGANLSLVGDRAGEGITMIPRRTETPPLPDIPHTEIAAIYAGAVPRPSGPSSGSGARRDLVFDKEHLIAQVTEMWNRWMLSPDEAPLSVITGYVDSYIREASAFWQGKGGQLDFDTFIRDKMKAHPRYSTIYSHKLPGQSEEEFLQSFMAPISSLGQRNEFTRAQTEMAVQSNAGPADQLKRVRRTREVETSGGFSQRLAKTLQGIGVG